MYLKKFWRVAVLFFLTAVLGGCNSGSSPAGSSLGAGVTGGGSDAPAEVVFRLVDAPDPDISSAWVTISDVSVHLAGGGWFSVLEEPIEHLDLLELQNGVSAMLGSLELAPGKYTQIRMVVDSAEVERDGEIYPVVIPSGEIKINRNIEICSGAEMEIVLDFDAEKSLHYTPGRNLFMMKPVIKVESVSSSCSGPCDDDGEVYDGALGWLSIILPPVELGDFSSLTAMVTGLRLHSQGGGQVVVPLEPFEADLLADARQVKDPDSGQVIYIELVLPVQVPVGNYDHVSLLFDSIVAVAADGSGTVVVRLPLDEDSLDSSVGSDDQVFQITDSSDGDEDCEDDGGFKFSGSIEVCEASLTSLMWDLDLSVAGLPFSGNDTVTELEIHPVTFSPNLFAVCESYEPPVEEVVEDELTDVDIFLDQLQLGTSD